MAINQEILVKVLTSKAEQAIDKLEGTFDRLADKAQNIRVGVSRSREFSRLRNEVDKVSRSLERFGSIGAAAGVVGIGEAVNTLARDLQSSVITIERFGQSFDIANGPVQAFGTALRNLTAPLDGLTTAFSQLGATGQATAAGIALATTGLVAFAPQVQAAAKGVFKLGQDAKKTIEAVTGLNEGFELTAAAAKKLEQSISAAGLKKALSEAVKEQQNLVASNEEFRNKTVQVLDLEEQLTAELREQQRVIRQVSNERLGAALQRTGLAGAVSGSTQRLLPAFQERGLQQLNTGYAEALRLTQARAAATRTTANVEEALTTELTRGTRFREKSAEAAQRIRDYNGKTLTTSQGISQAMSVSAKVSNSWQVALQQGARWQKLNAAESKKLLQSNEQTLSVYNAQIQAQRQLAELDKRRTQAQKEQKALADANTKRLESVALGVGFPLLFGAGTGSVLGSLAGSFAGQGFGGQIFGGAIGQAIDDFVASAAELGQALNPLTFDIEEVTKAAGLSGTELEQYIQAIEESGDAAGAAQAAQEALASVVGYDGVTALEDFGAATTRLGNAFERAMATMAAGVARLINSIPGFIRFTQNLEDSAVLARALQSQDPTQLANQRALEQARVGTGGVNIAKQQAAIQRLIKEQRLLEASGDAANTELNRRKLDLAKQQLAVTKLGGDLTDDAVFAAEKELLARRNALEIEELKNKELTRSARNKQYELLYVEQTNRAEQLRFKRQQALNKAAENAARKAQQESSRTSRQREQSLKSGKRILDQLELQIIKLSDIDKTQLAIREAQFRRQQTQASINVLLDEEQRNVATVLNKERERLAIQKAYEEGAKRIFKLNEEFYKGGDTAKLTELTEVGSALTQTFKGVGDAVGGAVNRLVAGSDSVREVFISLLRDLSRALAQYAVQAIAQYTAIGLAKAFAGLGTSSVSGNYFSGDAPSYFTNPTFGVAGALASGGPAVGGKPYLVGEEGPELFVPGRSGTVVPNDKMGGGEVNSVVNVTVNSDGSASTDASQATALGRLIESSVVGVIQRERRPGGILSR